MDHGEALSRIRAMVAKRMEFEKEHMDGREREDVPQERLNQYQLIQAEIAAFGARINGDPELMDLVAVWNVGVRGKQAISQDVIAPLARIQDPKVRTMEIHQAMLRLGGMTQAVIHALQENGYQLHSNELSPEGWRVGCRATEGASRRLCALLHRKFHRAIRSETILVERWFADFTLLANGK